MDYKTMKTTANTISQWALVNRSLYFFLPDGPYGRPFDNQYTLTRVTETEHGIDLIFGEGEILKFTGCVLVTAENNDASKLSLYGFDEVSLFLNGRKLRHFNEGIVTLVSR